MEGASLPDSAEGVASVESLMLCGKVLNAPSLRIGIDLLNEAEAWSCSCCFSMGVSGRCGLGPRPPRGPGGNNSGAICDCSLGSVGSLGSLESRVLALGLRSMILV